MLIFMQVFLAIERISRCQLYAAMILAKCKNISIFLLIMLILGQQKEKAPGRPSASTYHDIPAWACELPYDCLVLGRDVCETGNAIFMGANIAPELRAQVVVCILVALILIGQMRQLSA